MPATTKRSLPQIQAVTFASDVVLSLQVSVIRKELRMAHSRSLFFDRWPRAVTRRPWWVLAGALFVLVLLGGVSQAAGGKFVDSFSIPGTEAQKAIDLLKNRFPQQSGDSST